ncbi:MAG: hypothetical protein ACKPKO_16570 [Candidatus Fonsibacter sp.]
MFTSFKQFVNDFELNFNLLSLDGVTAPFTVKPVVFNAIVGVTTDQQDK